MLLFRKEDVELNSLEKYNNRQNKNGNDIIREIKQVLFWYLRGKRMNYIKKRKRVGQIRGQLPYSKTKTEASALSVSD